MPTQDERLYHVVQTLEEHQARNSEYLMDFDAWIMLAGIGIVIAALIYTAMVT